MRKQEQNSKKGKKNPTKAVGADATIVKTSQVSKTKNLSLIFSKLAEFEDQRADEDFFGLLGDDADFLIPSVNLSEELHLITTILENDLSATEKLYKLRIAFQDKLSLLKELEDSIPPALTTCRATYKERDLMIIDSLRLKQDITTFEDTYKVKAELCRSLQSRNKEYEATSQLLLLEEAKKTEELRAKCLSSIVNITKQIEDEEALVITKKEENDSLAVKITEFNSHLVIRDEHLYTQRKARAIELQLLEAKKTQFLRAEEQRAENGKSYQNHLLQLKEAEKDLERQVGLYMEKASSFESTLGDTKAVFQQFEDRVDTMMREVQEIELEIQKQEVSKLEKKDKLLKMQLYIATGNTKIIKMKDDHSLTDQCRALQARRTDLTKDLAQLNPPSRRIMNDNISDTDGVTAVVLNSIEEDLIDDRPSDRPSEEIPTVRSGRNSPHQLDNPWAPVLSSSSSSRSSATPPSSSSRAWTESATKENTAGEDTPVSSPSIHTPKRMSDSII